jgi:hypothetical protein
MPETIHILGEGGGIHAMDLPLPEPIEERLRKGMLTRVNEDGSPYVPAGHPATPQADYPPTPAGPPGKNAPKADWVGWAVTCGADAEEADGMTKADLVERYGTPAGG